MKTLCLVSLLLLLSPVASLAQSTGSAILAWNPGPGTNVITNYKLYQGTASHTYTVTNSVGTNLTYTASGLVRGTTYYFAATATDNNGLESLFSSEVTYQTPIPPAPPTGLRIVTGN